jgi:phosphoribosylformylglycinamidine cyclo-ligase
MKNKIPLTYKKAGVDIDKAEAFVKRIGTLIKSADRPEILGKIGGFSGLFMPRLRGMKDPVLVSSTDGVGTKLLIAEMLGRYDTVGIDLVAMCVDDVVMTGAESLFFLDYIACGRLDSKKLESVIQGMVKGCRQAECALISGETAELPGMYGPNQIDLAGFCVGIVDREKIIDGRHCQPGDRVVGFASNGIHSNGFSLVRRIFSVKEIKGALGKELIRPTKIYTHVILSLMRRMKIQAISHITGGDFIDNIPRVIPEGLSVQIRQDSWSIPPLFRKIQKRGKIEDREMFRTFNMGVGMVVVVSTRSAQRCLSYLRKQGQKAWIIGELIKGNGEVVFV